MNIKSLQTSIKKQQEYVTLMLILARKYVHEILTDCITFASEKTNVSAYDFCPFLSHSKLCNAFFKS